MFLKKQQLLRGFWLPNKQSIRSQSHCQQSPNEACGQTVLKASSLPVQAGRPPVAMRRFVRSFVERRHGTGTEAAAALMLDLVTGA